MRDLISMVLVLTVLSAFSGGILASVKQSTSEKIEFQQLKFEKAPAIKMILTGCTNDPMIDRFKLKDGDQEISFFVGKVDGKVTGLAFETFGKGFEGKIGLMVGVNIDTMCLIGGGVTTQSETPGVGSKAKTDPKFVAQFENLPVAKGAFKVKPDGGGIDALSGATITSRGVCIAATDAVNIYNRLEDQLKEKLKAYSK